MRKKDAVEKFLDGMLIVGIVGLAFGLGMKLQAKRGARYERA